MSSISKKIDSLAVSKLRIKLKSLITQSDELSNEIKPKLENIIDNADESDLLKIESDTDLIIEGWAKYGIDFYKTDTDQIQLPIETLNKFIEYKSELIKSKKSNSWWRDILDIDAIKVLVGQKYINQGNWPSVTFDDSEEIKDENWVLVLPLKYSKAGLLVNLKQNADSKFFDYYFVKIKNDLDQGQKVYIKQDFELVDLDLIQENFSGLELGLSEILFRNLNAYSKNQILSSTAYYNKQYPLICKLGIYKFLKFRTSSLYIKQKI